MAQQLFGCTFLSLHKWKAIIIFRFLLVLLCDGPIVNGDIDSSLWLKVILLQLGMGTKITFLTCNLYETCEWIRPIVFIAFNILGGDLREREREWMIVWYIDLFLCLILSALISLAFLVIHTFSMIIAFNGYEDGKKNLQLFPPALHFTASFLVSQKDGKDYVLCEVFLLVNYLVYVSYADTCESSSWGLCCWSSIDSFVCICGSIILWKGCLG